MRKRVGLLGPFQLVGMGVHDEVLNQPHLLEKLPHIESRSLTYSCLIQAGFDRLDIMSTSEEDLPKLPTLKARVKARMSPYWVHSFLLVHGAFTRHISEYDAAKAARKELGDLERFLIDLLFALAERKALVTFTPFQI